MAEAGPAPPVRQVAVASGVAAMVARLLTHPMDTIRARLQVDVTRAPSRGVAGEMRRLVSVEGLAGLYRGFPVTAAFVLPAQSVYVTMYELSKARASRAGVDGRHAPLVHLTSGFVAEIFSGLLWTPMEVIKQRQQVFRDAGMAACARQIWTREGPAGFLRGYGLTLASFGPFSALYFMFYEQFKRRLGRPGERRLDYSRLLISAGGAGSLAAALTCPLDVIKTRRQCQGGTDAVLVCPTFRAAVADIWRKEGPGAFFKGVAARVLYVAPGTAITMATYDALKSRWISQSP